MRKAILASALLGLSINAFGQTSKLSLPSPVATEAESGTQTSTLKTGTVLNKKFEDDKDITDARMKADSGSLSRYSLKFSLSYSGPPVGRLSDDKQPNPDGSVCACDTSFGGSFGTRFRFDSKSALSLGTGVNMLTPFNEETRRYEAKNPYISYDRNGRVGDLQMRNGVSATYVTNQTYRDIGEYAGVGYDTSLLYNFGTSRVGVGIDASFNYYFFDRGPDQKAKKELTTGRYSLGFYPQIKYAFSDKFSTYSSLALNFNNPRGTEDNTVLWNRTLSQRLGFGYAFTRDVYFAPYFNFYPKTFSADSTTVNFATTFSIL
ncbi:hypothetical protein B9G69_000915 [Bdellovibrio sp. SKB1291214]|uniref:hypothetical protein n=1 Tax=Bdellovibrio sp. SKB1291214 TaxID=1732569 RepID=UPI000B51CBFA|nr:hypothetical protein [Bdellovibrio sp. SKB1291214]UYL09136.1 hypothetical protein B9G69_000915 [Bdellovibrio sp. SKB1291214]